MSGIVASYLNHRGSGLVANLGTDGQIFTSAGIGKAQGFEAAAGGGKILQVCGYTDNSHQDITSQSPTATGITVAITPTSATNRILVQMSTTTVGYDNNGTNAMGTLNLWRDIGGGGFSRISTLDNGSLGSEPTFGQGVHRIASASESSGYIAFWWRYKLDFWDGSYDSTSEVTYKIYGSNDNANNVYFCPGEGKYSRTITAFEVDQS